MFILDCNAMYHRRRREVRYAYLPFIILQDSIVVSKMQWRVSLNAHDSQRNSGEQEV
jgi:hypothetical protein